MAFLRFNALVVMVAMSMSIQWAKAETAFDCGTDADNNSCEYFKARCEEWCPDGSIVNAICGYNDEDMLLCANSGDEFSSILDGNACRQTSGYTGHPLWYAGGIENGVYPRVDKHKPQDVNTCNCNAAAEPQRVDATATCNYVRGWCDTIEQQGDARRGGLFADDLANGYKAENDYFYSVKKCIPCDPSDLLNFNNHCPGAGYGGRCLPAGTGIRLHQLSKGRYGFISEQVWNDLPVDKPFYGQKRNQDHYSLPKCSRHFNGATGKPTSCEDGGCIKCGDRIPETIAADSGVDPERCLVGWEAPDPKFPIYDINDLPSIYYTDYDSSTDTEKCPDGYEPITDAATCMAAAQDTRAGPPIEYGGDEWYANDLLVEWGGINPKNENDEEKCSLVIDKYYDTNTAYFNYVSPYSDKFTGQLPSIHVMCIQSAPTEAPTEAPTATPTESPTPLDCAGAGQNAKNDKEKRKACYQTGGKNMCVYRQQKCIEKACYQNYDGMKQFKKSCLATGGGDKCVIVGQECLEKCPDGDAACKCARANLDTRSGRGVLPKKRKRKCDKLPEKCEMNGMTCVEKCDGLPCECANTHSTGRKERKKKCRLTDQCEMKGKTCVEKCLDSPCECVNTHSTGKNQRKKKCAKLNDQCAFVDQKCIEVEPCADGDYACECARVNIGTESKKNQRKNKCDEVSGWYYCDDRASSCENMRSRELPDPADYNYKCTCEGCNGCGVEASLCEMNEDDVCVPTTASPTTSPTMTPTESPTPAFVPTCGMQKEGKPASKFKFCDFNTGQKRGFDDSAFFAEDPNDANCCMDVENCEDLGYAFCTKSKSLFEPFKSLCKWSKATGSKIGLCCSPEQWKINGDSCRT